jgi:plastocyanin
MKQGMSKGAFFSPLAILLILGLSTQAATYYVTVDDVRFSPSTLTIEAGDTVVWENTDDFDFPHTTTSTLGVLDPDYWNGYLLGLGDTFSKTFNNPGTFDYIDQAGSGAGRIIVNPAAEPVIILSSPQKTDGQFVFEASGLTPGNTNVLLASTDLITWTAVHTNTATGDTMAFTNTATAAHEFYRVVELP